MEKHKPGVEATPVVRLEPPDISHLIGISTELDHPDLPTDRSPLWRKNLLVTLQEAAHLAQALTKCSGAAIAIGESRRLVCIASAGESAPPPGSPIRSEHGLAAECIRTKATASCSDTRSDVRVDHEACEQLRIASIVYVPIVDAQSKVIGLLGAFSAEPRHFMEADLNRLWGLAEVTGAFLTRNSPSGGLAAGSPHKLSLRELPELSLQAAQISGRSRMPIFVAAMIALVAVTASSLNYRRANAKPAKTAFASQATAPKPISPTQQPVEEAKLLTVVIDPGHGGNDQGATSPTGLQEKELTLDIAQRLNNMLTERLPVNVVLTRSDDSYVSLESRAAAANQAHADFLISIHGNSSSYDDVRGVETYYLRSPEQPQRVSEETAAETNVTREAARSFAADVQAALLIGLKEGKRMLRDRGVKPASFVILREVQMPAILAEVSFLSSSKDAQQLDSAEYREKVAEALYQGIANHIARVKSENVVASLKKESRGGD